MWLFLMCGVVSILHTHRVRYPIVDKSLLYCLCENVNKGAPVQILYTK